LEQLRQGELFPEIEFDLLDEAIRLPCLYEYEFLVSLSSSRINLESYQVLAVYRVIRQFPYRFLIADDTRSKKTIEAEIILEELTAPGRAPRVLIVAPAPLHAQWQGEKARSFNCHFVLQEGVYLCQLAEKSPPAPNHGNENRGLSPC
jgi:SNF2 family DNA or RNA helicase